MAYIFSLIIWVYLHSFFCGGLRKTHLFWNRMRIGCSRSSKVVDFGTNRKGICDFLLLINSNFGPILHRFWDTASYLLKIANFSYPTLVWRPRSGGIRQNFRMKVSMQKLDGWGYCMVKITWSFVTDPPVWRTDRQTDGIAIAYARLQHMLSRAKSKRKKAKEIDRWEQRRPENRNVNMQQPCCIYMVSR